MANPSSWRSRALALAFVAAWSGGLWSGGLQAAVAPPVEDVVRAYFNDGVPFFAGAADALPRQTGCDRIQSVIIERVDGNRVEVAVATNRPALDVAHYTLFLEGDRVARVTSRERELADAYVAAPEHEREALLERRLELANVTFARFLARLSVDRLNREDRDGADRLADELTRIAGDDLRKRAAAVQLQSVLARTRPGAPPGAGTELARESYELATRGGDAGLAAASLVLIGRSIRTVDEEAAVGYLQRALAMESEISEPSAYAQAATQLADLFDRVQRFTVAMRYAMEALRHAEAAGDRTALLAARMNLGGSFWQQADYVTAVPHYEAALELARVLGFPIVEAGILNRLSETYARMGREEEAAVMAQRALEGFGCGPETSETAEMRFDLLQRQGSYWLYANDLHRAEATATEMLDAAFRSAVLARTGAAFARFADIRFIQGRTEEALWFIRGAGDDREAASVLAKMYCASGRTREAEEVMQGIIASYELHGDQVVNDPRMRLSFFRTRATWYVEVMRLMLDRNADAEALELAERWKGRVLQELIARPPASPAAMTDEERAVMRRLEEKVRDVNRGFVRGEGDPDARRLARLEQHDHQARLRARYGDRPSVAPLDAPAAQAADVVIEYALGDEETIAFVISGAHHVEAVRLPVGRARLRELAAAYRRMLQNRDLRHRRLARELYALLVAPALRDRRPATLVIVPDDVLWTIPFHALAVDDHKLLLDRTAVSYAPSLRVLDSAVARRTTPLREARVLAVGNAGTASLPEAAREVGEIGRLYGARARTLTGATATEEAVKGEAPDHGIVHIATHGSVDAQFPMYSALLLAGSEDEDGLLEARELMELELDAELLVLSACETASGDLVDGEGVVGLSWAALGAGARTAVVSQWRVDSAATAELMIRFHRRIAAGLSPARALREAQRELAKDPRFAHPFDWAGFIVVGAP
jgi:CHAT domain-containing protein